jgi:hypothetical protein
VKNIGIKSYLNDKEVDSRSNLVTLLKDCPIPSDQMLENLGLFLTSKDLSRILFMDYIYKQIVDIQGVVFDFGTRWGNNLAIFTALRGIYEPFNRARKIIGFDTFQGFPSISEKDGKSDLMKVGNIATTDNYSEYLNNIIQVHESVNPLSHIKKHDIVVGDATKQLPIYLENNPETIVSLVYFDFDIYDPTKKCLEIILPRLTKGSVLAFDELNDHDSPGETLALMEVLSLNKVKLQRYRYTSRVSYFVFEGM